jgi:hypothetical protein
MHRGKCDSLSELGDCGGSHHAAGSHHPPGRRYLVRADKEVTQVKLIYNRPPGAFLITAGFDELLSLQKKGFHICRFAKEGTDDAEYVPVPVAELRRQWDELQKMDTLDKWSFPKEHAVWSAFYLLDRAGALYREVKGTALAAVITPSWTFIRRNSEHLAWSFQIGLSWPNTATLNASSHRLIALMQEQAG